MIPDDDTSTRRMKSARNFGLVAAVVCVGSAAIPPLTFGSVINAFFAGASMAMAMALHMAILRDRAVTLIINQRIAELRESHEQLMATLVASEANPEAPPLTPPDHPTMH
jgi:hypothetical protein